MNLMFISFIVAFTSCFYAVSMESNLVSEVEKSQGTTAEVIIPIINNEATEELMRTCIHDSQEARVLDLIKKGC